MIAFQKSNVTAEEAKSGKHLVGYQKISCHMIFDIKMDGLVRKARYVANGATTDVPSSVTYSSVVSRDSVRLGFMIAALNDLDVMAADLSNAYLNAPCREKIYTIAGPEFRVVAPELEGCVLLIVRALYGLKSSSAAWRNEFAGKLKEMGFVPTKGDNDVYLRPMVKGTGERYYELVLVYVDDILVISHDPEPVMKEGATSFAPISS